MLKNLNRLKNIVLISLILISLAGIIAGLIVERNLKTTHYITLSFCLVLSLVIAFMGIYNYVLFRKSYKKRFEIYLVELVNSSSLTMDVVKKSQKMYYKKFKRTMLGESATKIAFICGEIGIVVLFISVLCG